MRIKVKGSRPSYEAIQSEAGTSYFTRICGPIGHFQFSWHRHPEFELALVTEGRGRRYVGDSMAEFTAGDLVLLGPNLAHTWHSDPADGRVKSRVIQFLPGVFGNLLQSVPELKAITALLSRSTCGLQAHGPTRDTCERLVLRIVDGVAEGSVGGWSRISDLITLLGTMADCGKLTELGSTPIGNGADERSERTVDQVFALLHRDPAHIPPQSEAARALGMSPASFSRFFRHEVGRTYVDCVQQIRIMAACRELMETDLPIIQVALDAGFDNLSNFNRRFRALRGMTPTAFRNQSRG